ncbi:MAG: 4Fe-4S binding protein [Bacteroidales bacterium]|nr:4Fe-4S binding protein [Bacteroidales bacterium]
MQRVPVIDASKCTYCGRCHEYCHYNAIFILPPARYIQVIEDLCHGCGACLVACNDNAITEKEVPLGQVTHFRIAENAKLIEARMKTGVFSPVSVIKAAIREANGTDLVIMDAPPGTSCPFIQTVDKADFVVLVTEPTPFGLSDLQQSVQTLRHMNKSMGVIINRAGLGNDAVHEWLQQEGIPLLLEIPFDKQIAAAYSNGRLIAQEQPEMEEAFAALFDTILEHHGNSHHQR